MDIGTKVKITAIAKRKIYWFPRSSEPPTKPPYGATNTHHPDHKGWRIVWKVWAREELEAPIEAYYMGWRTYSDGVREYWNDEGYSFVPKRHHKVYMVVVNERQNPIPVFEDDLSIVECETSHKRNAPDVS